MPFVPERDVSHGGVADDVVPEDTSSVGHADAALHDAWITDADRKRWRAEDEERDLRRIPPGFVTE